MVSKFLNATVPAATPARIGSSAQRLIGFVVYAAANTVVEFKNAATDTGTVKLTVGALAGTSLVVDLSELGGIFFDVGIFCKPVGAGSLVYAWYE